MAKERQQAAVQFYNQLLGEVKGTYERGPEQLAGVLRD